MGQTLHCPRPADAGVFSIFVLFLRGPKVRVFWSFYFALFFIFV